MDRKAQILTFASRRDWTGLEQMLGGLTHTEFRRVESVVRGEVLPQLDNEAFWELLHHLVLFKKSAFISGVSAIGHLARSGALDFRTEAVRQLSGHLAETHPDAPAKLCHMALPLLATVAQAEALFAAFRLDTPAARLPVLLRTDTTLAYYLLFKTLKMAEDKTLARKCCMSVIKRGHDRAYNAASLIKAYFGLDDLPARLSLHIEPYELSHIDRDFQTFEHALNGKRPTI